MGEWEERIQQVLNDPAQMAELSRLAQSLMGGGDAEPEPDAPPTGGLDAALLSKAAKLLREDTGSEGREGLLRAMEPWLAPKRREKLERALRLARLSHLAKLAFGEGKGDV